MVPPAEHVYDATATFIERTAPLPPRMPADRAQTARLDAVEARLIAGYKARWQHLAGVAALCALAVLLLTFSHVL